MAKAPKINKIEDISLETVMMNCRNALRGKVGGNEKNRDTVMGLVFLKFVGDKFTARRAEIQAQYPEIFWENEAFYRSENVFYLSEHARWSYIVENASSDDIAIKIDTAMADIEERNPPLKGALPQNFYATLGIGKKEIKSLIDEINKLDNNRFHEKDLIGRVQEYFLQVFAIDSGVGKEKGEFYTPSSIVELIAELIEPYNGTVYDPCCGTGGMFVQSLKFVENHQGNRKNISIVGQESNPDTWRLAKMNLALRGIAHNLGESAVSTFTHDQWKDLKVNYIMANPPFNLKDWRDQNELTDDPRFAGYAVPPKSNANYAWILHMLSKLDETDGIAGFLLANGALNTGGDKPDTDTEYAIRKQLIENDKVEAIIVLPREMFYSTDISVTLWIVNNNKKQRSLNGRQLRNRQNEILFMDLRTLNSHIYEKKYVQLTAQEISQVCEIYFNWQTGKNYQNIPEFCQSVSVETIRSKNYSLAPSQYIEFVDKDLGIDYQTEMNRIQMEMSALLVQEKQSQAMLEKAFAGIGFALDKVAK
ncbi:type I restriction-modification system methyltransferase subunit like protein [Actinobacillus minor NM305]|uniref:site-specific DNA-methyltransferase (adenine-specific) n=1 Tax=Actinobacillus minor NM305 TaxID=637911 RepID=C5RYW3_9PAST|nr:type I restriction-modification system subunit M [Actinobacillus minor]EER48150.1 type I restriction-modification system methyltransferase subunit like protein [Actinobacillus minor NM305]